MVLTVETEDYIASRHRTPYGKIDSTFTDNPSPTIELSASLHVMVVKKSA
jgi:hypothetical protein